MSAFVCLLAAGWFASAIQEETVSPPVFGGDPEAIAGLQPWLEGAIRSTAAFGAWPGGAWQIRLHDSDGDFERATRAPTERHAIWIGSTLHLRPWVRLQRRDLGAVLRHELTHRRLAVQGLPRWKEEAVCLWAEGHTRPPASWPPEPEQALQRRLNLALESGTTASQRWAYAWLRAWISGRPLPAPPAAPRPGHEPWRPEGMVRVVWPPERLPRRISVNGTDLPWRSSKRFRFEGRVRFGEGMPVAHLTGDVMLEAVQGGWRMTWTAEPGTWIAAATEGELGSDAPAEAKRALAAVLHLWLRGHPRGNHSGGHMCPLTHCAVVRGQPSAEGLEAAASAPELGIAPDRALFTGSQGGVPLSPLEVWGGGSAARGSARQVPGDPWGAWTRVLSPAQVQMLKGSVKPGVKPGQRGLRLGVSGPYPVEDMRLEAGRRFGWTTWPSNACEAELGGDGSLHLRGNGWGHNVGLCLATAIHRARLGDRAEAILADAFGLSSP